MENKEPEKKFVTELNDYQLDMVSGGAFGDLETLCMGLSDIELEYKKYLTLINEEV